MVHLYIHTHIKFFGEGNVNPLQCSHVGGPMDGGGWKATVHTVWKQSDTTKVIQHTHRSILFLNSVLES